MLTSARLSRCIPCSDFASGGDGKLAMVWSHRISGHLCEDGVSKCQVAVFVSVFKVIKMRGPNDGPVKALAAQLLYHKRYQAHGRGFIDCIAVFNSRKVEAHEELTYGSNRKMKKREKKKKERKEKFASQQVKGGEEVENSSN